MLHTVSHSFYQIDNEALLKMVMQNDVILLLQDGVTAAIFKSDSLERLKQTGVTIYALHEDVEARGLKALVGDDIELVDYQGFVDLTIAHSPQIVW